MTLKDAPSSRDAARPTFTVPPVVSPNPNPKVPLAALVRFAADRPVRTTVHVSDGQREWERTYDDSWNPQEGLPVLGMRPGRQHQLRVSIEDEAGNGARAPEVLTFTTPPLPAGRGEFPPIRVTVS